MTEDYPDGQQHELIQRLGRAMRELQEACFCASWIEAAPTIEALCRAAVRTGRPQPWGRSVLSVSAARSMWNMARRLGAWACPKLTADAEEYEMGSPFCERESDRLAQGGKLRELTKGHAERNAHLLTLGLRICKDSSFDSQIDLSGTVLPEAVTFHFLARTGWVAMFLAKGGLNVNKDGSSLWYDERAQLRDGGGGMPDEEVIRHATEFLTDWRAGAPGKETFRDIRRKRLEALGLYRLLDWMSEPPTQITGCIDPERVWFYLRIRSGEARMDLYSEKPTDPHDWGVPLWSRAMECSDDLHIEHEELVGIVSRILERWRAGEASDPDRR